MLTFKTKTVLALIACEEFLFGWPANIPKAHCWEPAVHRENFQLAQFERYAKGLIESLFHASADQIRKEKNGLRKSC
jgi:hypothetical protein